MRGCFERNLRRARWMQEPSNNYCPFTRNRRKEQNENLRLDGRGGLRLLDDPCRNQLRVVGDCCFRRCQKRRGGARRREKYFADRKYGRRTEDVSSAADRETCDSWKTICDTRANRVRKCGGAKLL